ncbi:hypothetical protein BN77_1947 [Rhizobium mesoamericanum STM3625]|uniref:SnoaL-like domain-containing protein n=1 Tax=Rhizobium mesoamericanum STM3625 TaxID=1211777 RepID=K0PUJ1_9HYPH|nr:hypothetical protein BN77_1947 [Rhizobium mesoamericanum STM3625]
MAHSDSRREQIVRSLYEAYVRGRKDDACAILTEDFTFSSPRDDHIDRTAYSIGAGPNCRHFAPWR